LLLIEKDINPRKFWQICDEYFVSESEASFDAELVVRALEKGLIIRQLYGRLDKNHPIFKTSPPEIGYLWVKTRFASLVPANYLLRNTLEAHSDFMNSVAVDDVSTSRDYFGTTIQWSIGSEKRLNPGARNSRGNSRIQEVHHWSKLQCIHNYFKR